MAAVATDREPAPSALLELARRRSSCRAYAPEPVPEATIRLCLECARLAPSACNRQPWRFAVVRDPPLRARIVHEGFLPGLGMAWAAEAPVLLVLGMVRDLVTHRIGAGVAGVDYPWVDIGIAGEHFVLAATEQGLGTCWIGWIRPRTLRRLLGWPPTVRPVAVITVGRPAPDAPPRPPAERRRPLEDLVLWR
ncbi:MAG: nitroreductase family protein [Kiritimatiellae bacterium]|nr:nitroreductase family protein [Kiritimatiellia bacterium]